MAAGRSNRREKPRELRRRVVLPARLNAGSQWSDACILNVSSRGLMIQSGRAVPEGATVELRRGDHVIVARVMWREGARAGLYSDERLPVDDILSGGNCDKLKLVAADGALIDRRRKLRRSSDDSRLRGRLIEFAGVTVIAITLAASAWAMADRAFGAPLEQIDRVLSSQS